jgi:hypothetical protein
MTRVVVVAELEERMSGREIFGVVIVDAVPPANRQSYLANDREVLSVELFCVHAGAAWTRGQDSGRRSGEVTRFRAEREPSFSLS